MALPHRRQNLAKYIPYRDLTAERVAEILGITRSEVYSLSQGHRYPSPTELDALTRLLDCTAEDLFDPSMLAHREAKSWPPHGKGFRPTRRS